MYRNNTSTSMNQVQCQLPFLTVNTADTRRHQWHHSAAAIPCFDTDPYVSVCQPCSADKDLNRSIADRSHPQTAANCLYPETKLSCRSCFPIHSTTQQHVQHWQLCSWPQHGTASCESSNSVAGMPCYKTQQGRSQSKSSAWHWCHMHHTSPLRISRPSHRW